MKSPCLSCPIGDSDKSNPACLICSARTFYVVAVAVWDTLPAKDKSKAEAEIQKLIPTQEQIKAACRAPLTKKRDKPVVKRTNIKPRISPATYHAFRRAAEELGFSGIRDWLENDYLKHRRSGKYMRDKVGCAQVTLAKILTAYGMPQPAAHNSQKILSELDAERVSEMLDGGYTLKEIAKDQGCSTGLINTFKRVRGYKIKTYKRRGQ